MSVVVRTTMLLLVVALCVACGPEAPPRAREAEPTVVRNAAPLLPTQAPPLLSDQTPNPRAQGNPNAPIIVIEYGDYQ